jgi:hypothetical protein
MLQTLIQSQFNQVNQEVENMSDTVIALFGCSGMLLFGALGLAYVMTPLKKLQVGGFNRDSAPLLSIERPSLGVMPSNTMHFRSFSPTSWRGMTFFQ